MSTPVPAQSRRDSSKHALPLEVAMLLVTASVAYSFARVFSGWDFLRPMLVTAAVSHLVAAATRRLGWHFAIATAVSAAGLAVTVGLTFYRDTTWFGLPTADTWHLAYDEVHLSWTRFNDSVALVPARGGFLVASAVGMWLIAFIADTFAIRARAGFESMVPGAVLFVMISMLAANRVRMLSATLFIAAVLGFLAVHRSFIQKSSTGWLSAQRNSSTAALRLAAVAATLAIAAGVLSAPHLPGAGQKGLVNYTAAGGGGHLTTLSPLVDIRGRISGQSNRVTFVVKADRPALWRLMSLNKFDGKTWTIDTTSKRTTGTLNARNDGGSTTRLDQQYTLLALGGNYLPAALGAATVSGIDGLNYSRETASLVLDATVPSRANYDVASDVPSPSIQELRAAPAATSENVPAEFFALPSDLPDEIHQRALTIVGDATTPYDKARALQDYLRQFRYSLDTQAEPGKNPIVSILEQKSGYCEQLAGSFAAMARTLGLPARVAVGFTPGDETQKGTFVVRAKHAHAWPEVFFKGIGWVNFEPTPQRGAPGAEGWTGVPAAQIGDPVAPTPTAVTVRPSTPSTTKALGGPDRTVNPGEVVPLSKRAGSTSKTNHRPWPLTMIIWLAGTAGVLAVWISLTSALRWLVIRRRARASLSDADRVLAQWSAAERVLAAAGVRRESFETDEEFAVRVTRTTTLDDAPILRLADAATMARFAPSIADGVLVEAQGDSAHVTTQIRRRSTRLQRLERALDPRSVWR